MAGNTKPLFSAIPRSFLADAVLLTANATTDLTSGTIVLLATAGANGARLDAMHLQPLGTNVATVARFWLNNGGVTTTAANNRWFLDVTLPATTASLVASIPAVIIELNRAIDPLFRLYAVVGTTVIAGYHVVTFGGDY